MYLQATYDEINDIIAQKAGIKGLSLAYHSPDTTKVSFVVNLGLASPAVSAKVKLVSIEGSRVTAEIDAGSIGGFVLSSAKKMVIDKTPAGLIEHLDGKHAVLNLEAIPELKSVFDAVAVNGLSFSENAVCVDANLK